MHFTSVMYEFLDLIIKSCRCWRMFQWLLYFSKTNIKVMTFLNNFFSIGDGFLTIFGDGFDMRD